MDTFANGSPNDGRTATHKPKIGFIFFDLGNVLLNFDYEIGSHRLAELTGSSSEKVLELIYLGPLQTEYETGLITTEEFAGRINRQLGSNLPSETIVEAASAIFWPNAEIIPLVAALRSSGTRLGILSNTCSAHWNHVGQGQYRFLVDLFETRVLSFEVKSMKPDARIFTAAAKATGCDPSRIFFVDDRADNVAGALASGWKAHLYQGVRPTAAILRRLGLRFNY